MAWKGRYRGQRQKWFGARFTGKDSDIDLKAEHSEFMAWRWIAPAELPRPDRAIQAPALY